MIASALAELAASATADLPTQLAATSTKYGIALATPSAVQTWFAFEIDQIRSALTLDGHSLVSVRWASDATTQLTRPSAGVRDTVLPVCVCYLYKHTDIALVETHMKYVPEAMARWLDLFPTGTRSSGKTIMKIAPPLGRKITIRQKKEDVREANGVLSYIWHAEAEFEIEIRDVVP